MQTTMSRMQSAAHGWNHGSVPVSELLWQADGMTQNVGTLIAKGRASLIRCDWPEAQALFEEALAQEETADGLDGLGQALYWQGEYGPALARRERAYALYRQRGEPRRAVFVAVQLAQLHGLLYGNVAAVNGWLGHARRMLQDCEECAEHGWVELFESAIASDPAERAQHASAALDVGRRFATPDLEFDALGYLGKANVETGAVQRGIRMVDESVASVSSGLVTDPWAAGEIYCTLFHVCEMTVDVRRAESWLDAVDGYVARTGELPISAICRMHYGGVLTAAGRWDDAERELDTALGIYRNTYRGTAYEPLLRLADLRVRQGSLEEAERLLNGHEERSEALVPRVRLLLARGAAEVARSVLNRRLPNDASVALAPALALAVDVALACKARDDADRRAAALEQTAATSQLASMRGLAARARGRITAADGDREAASRHLDEALMAFGAAGLDHELAMTRRDLAELLADEAPDVARSEARIALDSLQRIGARRDADATAQLLRRLGVKARTWPRVGGSLTERQREVLGLLAEGLSNAQIAERLFLSPRTVEHHVGNILATLHLNSRTEAAAYAHRGQRPARTRT